MSKPTTSTKKSRSTAPAVNLETVKTDGTQDDAAVTTSAASGPSGLRAPDGINTGPADAGGSVADQNLTGEGHDQTDADAATASVNLSTDPSQGDAGGAGANAGSVSGETSAVLKVDDIGHLTETLTLAAIGRSLLEIIDDVARDYPELQEWIGSDDPAGIVRELVEENAVLKDIRKVAQHSDLQDVVEVALSETLGEHAERYASMTRDEFERDFPLSFALLSSFTEIRSMENPPLVRVTSKRDGFRRAGIAHSSRPVDYRPWDISPEQLEAILAEPLLTVEVV
ncbi:HI1506-related protein [Agrobacterium salinitolerans]|uniref:HI1506-related protein n=1 Tax=Agrobacterium salinitolerans TaxID=1183413 RepID=UPI0022B8175B|nr:HI1506-related protein [Agrobacterium salinitolerans]MCZ7886044.1 HI1506-related protein [Agrobacterium salinitolerans]